MRSLLSRLLIVVATLALALPVSANLGLDLMRQYFDFLSSGNVESASYLWETPSRERAQKFGISYTDIPLKMDCNSPLVRNMSRLRNSMYADMARVEGGLQDSYVKIRFSAKTGVVDSIAYTYFAKNDGKYLWLVYPEDYYARDWPVKESKYLRVHIHPDRAKRMNPVTLAEVDQHIKELCDTLQISAADQALLAEKKIDYYFCDSNLTVRDITGADTEGMYDMGSDDIISAQFPHYHEMVHFLIAYKLRNFPLYTLPIIREGAAVMLGGRWGKSPSSLLGLAVFLYKQDLVSLDSILTMTGFTAASAADVNYPVAGLFSTFIEKKVGMDGYLKTYLALSGEFDNLNILTPELVKARIAEATGYADWATFKKDFEAFLDSYASSYADVVPGDAGGKKLVNDSHVEVKESDKWITVIAQGGAAKPPIGTILFGADPGLKDTQSPLFELQFAEVPFEGYRYALRWDSNETGLYDYATNEISAKYIYGLAPDSSYYSDKDQKLTVKFRKELFNGVLPKDGAVKILEQ